MHGKNVIMKVDLHRDGSLFVHSVFMTIQGEGPLSGRPAVFVRLGGCSLACNFCDTEFEAGAERLSLEELLRRIMHTGAPNCRLVVVTGGEPFRQDLGPFTRALSRMGWHVQVETAGVHEVGPVFEDLIPKQHASIVCSPKTGRLHPEVFQYAGAFKYIIHYRWDLSAEDGLPVLGAPMGRHGTRGALARPRAGVPVYLQPLDDPLDTLARDRNSFLCASLAIKHGYRVSLQTHKIMGVA